jgi:hypothetical protein
MTSWRTRVEDLGWLLIRLSNMTHKWHHGGNSCVVSASARGLSMMMKGSRDKRDGREGNSSYCGEPPTLIVNDLNRDPSHHGANELYSMKLPTFMTRGCDMKSPLGGSTRVRKAV